MHSATLTLKQSSRFGNKPRRQSVATLYAAALLALLAIFAAAAPPLHAQEHWPPGAVARFTGDDISFEGSALGPPIPGGTSFFISSGTVLTVHSGDARLNFPGGGIVDICGPAKLTLLESNTVYTIALNFGRVHVQLADPTQLHVFTPFVMATPISIAEEARDLTIGLDINDRMCVFAAQGAARLEDQFSSEGLMVPQLGEFFLSGEKLAPTGGEAGTCRCFGRQAANQQTPMLAPQQKSTQPAIARSTAPPAQPAAQAPSQTAVQPPAHPAVQPPARPVAPPAAAPTYATTQPPPPTPAPTHITPSKPQRPATSAANQPAPSAPAVAASQPPSVTPATTPASPFPKASKSKPTAPPPSPTVIAQQPPPEISPSTPRSTSVIPTVEAAAPPPPPAPPVEASNPPEKTTPPPAARTITGSAPEADNGFNMPDHANETKPVAVHIFGSAPVAPQLEPPVRVVMPPLTFSANMPTPPVDANPQLITIVHEARVTKEWVFKGKVAETKPTKETAQQPENTKPIQARKKRRGILTVFKQFFGGSPPPPKP